ncbi:MAG: MFS transporter [Bauldia sp.]
MAKTTEVSPHAPRTLILLATIIASSMGFIDANVVTVALPTIQEQLGAEFAAVQWVLNGYVLMLAALIVVAGSLGDIYGRRRIFLAGIIVFVAASIACALAPSIGFLIGARVVQGFGAALLIPQSLAIISASFPKEIRGRAIGTWAAISAAMTALGPPAGGFLVDRLDWPVVFWINVPLGLLAIFLTARFVPESRNPDAVRTIDWTGSFLAIVGFGALTYGLSAFSDGFENVRAAAYIAIGIGVAAIAAFAFAEARVRNPLVPPALFHSPVFTGANILTVLLYGCLAAIIFLLPYQLGVRRGMSTGVIGLTMMPIGVIIAVASRFTGGLSDRIGPRPFLIVGPLLVAAACAVFALNVEAFWLGIMVPVLLLSFGMAIVVSPLTTAVMNSVSEGRSGAASGVNNAASRVGGLLAVAIFGALASIVFLANAPEGAERFGVLPEAAEVSRPAFDAAFDAAYGVAMWLAAASAALAAVATAIFIRSEQPAR